MANRRTHKHPGSYKYPQQSQDKQAHSTRDKRTRHDTRGAFHPASQPEQPVVEPLDAALLKHSLTDLCHLVGGRWDRLPRTQQDQLLERARANQDSAERDAAAEIIRIAQASAQHQLEGAIDTAMNDNSRHNNKWASQVLHDHWHGLGRLSDDLLKKVCAYAAKEHHAEGLNKWLYAYLDRHHAEHLERARARGDLETIRCVLQAYRSEKVKLYSKGLPPAWLNEVLAFGAEQAAAAGQSSDPQAGLIREQAGRLIGLAKELLELAGPQPEPVREAPPQAADVDLQRAWQDLNRLMLFLDGNETRVDSGQLKYLHGVADELRKVFKDRSDAHGKYAHELAGRLRAQATAELTRRQWNPRKRPMPVMPEVMQPVIEPAIEPAIEAVKEPVIEAEIEEIQEGPVTEPDQEAAREPAVEALQEPVIEPVVESAKEPLIEVLRAPAVETSVPEAKEPLFGRDAPSREPSRDAEPLWLPQSPSSYSLTSDYTAGVGSQRQVWMLASASAAPKTHTLTNNYFELTVPQQMYADNQVKEWASELAKEVAPEGQAQASSAAAKRYEDLLKSIAYQWTVRVLSYCDIKDFLTQHKSVDQPLGEGLRALCLLWSEDQSQRVLQLLEHDIQESGAPGLVLAQRLVKDIRQMVEDGGEQLYHLCQAGQAQAIVEFVQQHRWLPLLLMKRAWTRSEFGELIDRMHALAAQWQATQGEAALQDSGAVLTKLLPPPPMAWVSPKDFVDRLAKAVELRQLAEVDFALATHRDQLLKNLSGLPTASKQKLLEALDKLLEPMEVGFNYSARDGRASNTMKVSWLKRAGFSQMEAQVSLWRPLVQKSLEASRQ